MCQICAQAFVPRSRLLLLQQQEAEERLLCAQAFKEFDRRGRGNVNKKVSGINCNFEGRGNEGREEMASGRYCMRWLRRMIV